MKRYNELIREIREDKDLTQAQIADMLGIKQQVYSKYELGIRALPIEHLIKLCKYYKVSADWILGIKKEMN
jgi:transcriptional regulator with XRE-family HTH domain